MWHGWADPAIPPVSSISYYDAVRKTVGPSHTDEFLKLYMLPGVGHCGGGVGPDRIAFLSAVVNWVESSIAPDRIVASKQEPDGHATRTRPVFPYPLVARYSGTGSTDLEANFVSRNPERRFGDSINWLGLQQ